MKWMAAGEQLVGKSIWQHCNGSILGGPSRFCCEESEADRFAALLMYQAQASNVVILECLPQAGFTP